MAVAVAVSVAVAVAVAMATFGVCRVFPICVGVCVSA